MVTCFLNHLKKENLFDPAERILLTVSGGVDSMLMCELFHKAGLKFGIAHCNFQLRAEESDEDEAFVCSLAEKYNVTFHSVVFNTKDFAKKNKLSIQVAARQLRYQWFEEIRKNYGYCYIATAHHLDDSIETFLINLIRGTGISGLHGILPRQGNIIRPMLFTTKNEIEIYVKKHKLKYREDSSNASDKYVRNKIRHNITPVLKELNPGIENTINKNIQHFRDVELIYRNDLENKSAKIVKHEKDGIFISIQKLKKLNPVATYLYEFLKAFNFNASTVEEIISVLDGESGKQFFSNTHRLIKDRKLLIIQPMNKSQQPESKKLVPSIKIKDFEFRITMNQQEIDLGSYKLKFQTIVNNQNFELLKSPSIANLNFDKLEFPLEVRKWQKGDVFFPLGMKGKKKVSDFFIDRKLSINQKENSWILTSAGRIVWVIGQRIDEHYKITDKTRKIYFIELV